MKTKIFGISLFSIFISATLGMVVTGAGQPGDGGNPFLKKLKSALKTYNEHLPEERVYLHVDKPFYKPGDDIWFTAYVRNGVDLKPTQKSDILYVELVNPKGGVQRTHKLMLEKGRAKGDFNLDSLAPGGMYKLRAYTKWQDNDARPYKFEKDIQVQAVVLPNLKMKLDFQRKAYGPGDEVEARLRLNTNANEALSDYTFTSVGKIAGQEVLRQKQTTDAKGEAMIRFTLPADLNSSDGLLNVMIQYKGLNESVSRSIPILLNKVEFSFFPEGGDLVAGLESRVAFRAVDEFGMPADIEGQLLDSDGRTISGFRSYHDGMGAFTLIPQDGKRYFVKLNKPEGSGQTFTVPEALPQGFAMEVGDEGPDVMKINIRSTLEEKASLIAQVRGEVYWSDVVDLKKGDNIIRIGTKAFPVGVVQLTLFDGSEIARAERLAFINKHRQLKVEISTDKERYLPREKVDMTVKVSDERGLPLPGVFSLSVVNDQLLSFVNDKSGHILSELLMQQDLRAEVREPSFYFDKQEPKADQALDYLMMTAGWRRFTWKELTANPQPVVSYPAERASVHGVVYDSWTGQPIPYATISMTNQEFGKLTNQKGEFELRKLDLSKVSSLTVAAEGYAPAQKGVYQYGPVAFYLSPNTGRDGEDGLGMLEEEVEEMDFVADEPVGGIDMGGVMAGGGGRPRPRRKARMKPMEAAPMPGGGEGKNLAGVEIAAEKEAMQLDAVVVMAEVAVVEAVQAPAGDVQASGAPVKLGKKRAAKNKQAVANQKAVAANRAREVKEKDKNDNRQQDQFAQVADLEKFKEEGERKMEADRMDKDVRDARFMRNEEAQKKMAKAPTFYRAREFAAPVYASKQAQAPSGDVRNDFRSTLYWNPRVEVDRTGKAKVSFYTSDEITSFRATVEGIAATGNVGRSEHVFFSQLPFSLNARMPVEVATGDKMDIPVTLTNNTDEPLTGELDTRMPAGFKSIGRQKHRETIPPRQSRTVVLSFEVGEMPGASELEIAFNSQGHSDASRKVIEVMPQGFPVAQSWSGTQKSKTLSFMINDLVKGSLTGTFTAYPSMTSNLLKGIGSILREPYGCFEQTSTSSYPNVLVLNYFKDRDDADPTVLEKAKQLLDKGYKRLVTFETPNKGYEWFGHSPPHEALTAYGLMQFSDMKNVYPDLDDSMVDRTAKWLFSRKNGRGGFKRASRALDQFGSATEDVTNGYIVWALAEGGYGNKVQEEANTAYTAAINKKDPYLLAMASNSMFALGNKKEGQRALTALLNQQQSDGHFLGKEGSITRSGGVSLKVETTALAVLAMLKSEKPPVKALKDAVTFLVESRSGHGGFGSTQGTILALKALTAFADYAKATKEAGTINIYIDDVLVKSHDYGAGERGAIVLDSLANSLGEGTHLIKVEFEGVKNALPWSLAVDYNTSLPSGDERCVVSLDTKINSTKVKMGETVRLSATLKNKTQEGQPMTMAILGIPAGLSPQPWQLKELQEKQVFDFYEVIGNNVVCYYRQMKPGEVREINLDLKADVPGTYQAPASRAYLYYTAEYKHWTALPTVEVLAAN